MVAAKAKAILGGSSHVMPSHPVGRTSRASSPHHHELQRRATVGDDVINSLIEMVPVDAPDASDDKRLDSVMN